MMGDVCQIQHMHSSVHANCYGKEKCIHTNNEGKHMNAFEI